VVLKDTLRHHGIPFDWLACEVIIIARAPGEETLTIQLVVMKWNELLIRYAVALERQLLLGLDRFDPTVDHSKYIVSWRFAPDSGSPFAVMPDKKVWLQSSLPQPEEEPLPILDRRQVKRTSNIPKFDLPPPARPLRPPRFSPTEVLPLR
jgi:hypothetical protein